MSRGQPVLGYSSKTDAVIALHLEGLQPIEIARRIGSSNKSVCQLLSYARRDGKLAADRDDVWTDERVRKARRLFGTTMLYIAEAMGVSGAELFGRGLRGVLPTLGRAKRIDPLLREMSEEGLIGADTPPVPDDDERARDEAELAALEEDEDADPDVAVDEPETEPVGEESPAPGGRRGGASRALPETSGGQVAVPPPHALERFKLRNEAGEYLHLHTRGMTRLSQFIWRGDAAELKALQQRKPHLRELITEPC